MGLDFALLFLTCLAFYWMAGWLIHDVMSQIDDQWSKGHAWEDLYGQRDESETKGAA